MHRMYYLLYVSGPTKFCKGSCALFDSESFKETQRLHLYTYQHIIPTFVLYYVCVHLIVPLALGKNITYNTYLECVNRCYNNTSSGYFESSALTTFVHSKLRTKRTNKYIGLCPSLDYFYQPIVYNTDLLTYT